MELVPILEFVRRCWIALVVGAAIAVAATVVLLGRTPAGAGLARASVVLDSRPSQLIKPDPAGSETLGWRSSALANLATSPDLTGDVARRLGVPATDVLITSTVLNEPESTTAVARRAAKAAAVAWEPYIVLVSAREELGMVAITAHAASAAMARDAAQATQAALVGAAPKSTATPTPEATPEPGATPDPASPLAAPDVQERFVIEAASPVRARTVKEAGGALLAPIGGVAVFCLWFGLVTVLDGLLRFARGRRRTAVSAH